MAGKSVARKRVTRKTDGARGSRTTKRGWRRTPDGSRKVTKVVPTRAVSGKLDKVIADCRRLLSGADREEASAKFKVGEKVNEVSADKAYGDGAVEALAKKVGRSPQAIYKWAKVAKTWSLPQINGWLGRVGQHGFKLRFSHLLALLASPKEVEELVTKCLDDELSVRDLAEHLKLKSKRSRTSYHEDPQAWLSHCSKRATTIATSLKEMDAQASVFVRQVPAHDRGRLGAFLVDLKEMVAIASALIRRLDGDPVEASLSLPPSVVAQQTPPADTKILAT